MNIECEVCSTVIGFRRKQYPPWETPAKWDVDKVGRAYGKSKKYPGETAAYCIEHSD